jgi:hypothetical protein
MINIFIAYSGFDMYKVDNIVKYLQLSENYHVLWYYHKTISNITMDDILKKIALMDIFILFLSENSIDNNNVKKEIYAAMETRQIKEYITVIIDNKIKKTSR